MLFVVKVHHCGVKIIYFPITACFKWNRNQMVIIIFLWCLSFGSWLAFPAPFPYPITDGTPFNYSMQMELRTFSTGSSFQGSLTAQMRKRNLQFLETDATINFIMDRVLTRLCEFIILSMYIILCFRVLYWQNNCRY